MRAGPGPRAIATLAFLAGLAAVPAARAGVEDAGTTAANFLSLGAGARETSMAGAGLGLGDDLGGAAWNPAALARIHGAQLALSHAGLPDRSRQEWGAVGGRLGGRGARWGLSGLYRGEGTFEGTDDAGNPTGSFGVSSFALGVTLAQELGSHALLGVTARGVREQIASASGSGLTFDAGLLLRAGPLGLGLAARNVGGRMSYGPSRHPFPATYGVGVGYAHAASGLRVALDAARPAAYHPDLRAGVEWSWRGALALRAGYRHVLSPVADPESGPTFGGGAGHRGLWIDYGYLLTGAGGGQHRAGLRMPFGGPR